MRQIFNSEGKKRAKGSGNVSDDSGDDLGDHARNQALDSFAVDIAKAVPGAGGASTKKKASGGGKKGKGKGKKK